MTLKNLCKKLGISLVFTRTVYQAALGWKCRLEGLNVSWHGINMAAESCGRTRRKALEGLVEDLRGQQVWVNHKPTCGHPGCIHTTTYTVPKDLTA